MDPLRGEGSALPPSGSNEFEVGPLELREVRDLTGIVPGRRSILMVVWDPDKCKEKVWVVTEVFGKFGVSAQVALDKVELVKEG